MRRHHHQRQWRSGALRRYRLDGRARQRAGLRGPLAGILAGLDWLAAQNNGIEWLLSVPGDCPFLPDDLVERLHQARRKLGAGVPLACARSGEWRHPVVGLWPLALRESLRKALVEEEPAQDRGLDGAAWRRGRRLAG